ncbi:MAG: hypothetical protein ACOY58_03530, partial [Candidatus Micrarchaeota archaeon]
MHNEDPKVSPGIPLIEPGKADTDEVEESLMARVPFMTSTRKADYLGYRAMGFSVREACDLVPITFKTLLNWRRQDEEFARWEGGRLAELQSTIADDVLRFAFLRNMRLVLRIDGRLFERRLYDPNGMTSDDRKDYREAAKRYSATDLIAIEKATSREEEGQGEAGS